MPYPGIDGFLPTRASIMLDVVFVAMFLVTPAMWVSIYLAKYKRQWARHRTIQLALAAVLAVAVTAFELDMQFISGWRERAVESPYFASGWVERALYVHLVFAVSTAFLWPFVIVQALRKFSKPVKPGPHSRSHAFWGMAAAVDMTLTAVTGWVFYILAFAL